MGAHAVFVPAFWVTAQTGRSRPSPRPGPHRVAEKTSGLGPRHQHTEAAEGLLCDPLMRGVLTDLSPAGAPGDPAP